MYAHQAPRHHHSVGVKLLNHVPSFQKRGTVGLLGSSRVQSIFITFYLMKKEKKNHNFSSQSLEKPAQRSSEEAS